MELIKSINNMLFPKDSLSSEQETILDNVQAGVLFLRNRNILHANLLAEHIFGYAPGAMEGKSTRQIYLSDDQYSTIGARAYAAIARVNGSYEEEIQLKRFDGSIFLAHMRGSALDPEAPLSGSIWVIDDITSRKSAEDEIKHLAFSDTLTELPNRRLMLDRLGHAVNNSNRYQRYCALLLIDLDNFKSLNDTQGHEVGDLLLVAVAGRLCSCVRQADTVARMGGDEFLVLIEGLEGAEQAAVKTESVARMILDKLNKPYLLNVMSNGVKRSQHHHQCTSSIGITLFCGSAVSVDELMKRADTAMYQAKADGRNTWRYFDQEMQAAVTTRVDMENDLRRAIMRKQLLLYYQPQVDSSGQVTGEEVLVRWQHPVSGLISPDEFIPLAEECGLIMPLGQWVLEAACNQLATWSTWREMADLTIAVNVSALQFHHQDFVSNLLKVLEQSGARPERLKVELTESHLVKEVSEVIAKMTALKQKGVSFSLDDFGTGYSSLSYLKSLPLDQLKIDQSFVRDISIDNNDSAIVRAIVALAKNLGLAVIAEGVETAVQRDFLASHGCRTYQGFFFSHPLPLRKFEALASQGVRLGNIADHRTLMKHSGDGPNSASF